MMEYNYSLLPDLFGHVGIVSGTPLLEYHMDNTQRYVGIVSGWNIIWITYPLGIQTDARMRTCTCIESYLPIHIYMKVMEWVKIKGFFTKVVEC